MKVFNLKKIVRLGILEAEIIAFSVRSFECINHRQSFFTQTYLNSKCVLIEFPSELLRLRHSFFIENIPKCVLQEKLMKDKDSIPFCDQLRWGISLGMAGPTLLYMCLDGLQ